MDNDKLLILQTALKNILFQFAQFCSDHELRYYIEGGTLLGAVRHQGFIPWDDDIDVCMPAKDCDRFEELFKKNPIPGLVLNNYSCDHYTSGSYVLRVEDPNVKIGRIIGGKTHYINSWVSIFPMGGLPENERLRKKHISKLQMQYMLLRFARSSDKGVGKVKKRTQREQIAIKVNELLGIGKLFNTRSVAKEINKIIREYDYSTSEAVSIYAFKKAGAIYKRDWFGKPTQLLFEGRYIDAPSDYEAYLTQKYGDYMKMPPESERVPIHAHDIKVF